MQCIKTLAYTNIVFESDFKKQYTVFEAHKV